jgi:hypothetical protein
MTPTLCSVVMEGERCRYPKLVLPSGGRSTLCYWHRLARTSVDAQIRAAARRLDAATEPHRARVASGEWPDGERWCAGCQSFVPLFYARSSRCLGCAAKAGREGRRMSIYGLTPRRYDELVAVQDGRCAICRRRQTMRSIAVDHNHKTGDVRGLLCKRCNHDLLGGAYDSIRMILAAAIYLAVPPQSGDWIDPEEYGEVVMRAFLATVDDVSRSVHARTPRPRREAGSAASRTSG